MLPQSDSFISYFATVLRHEFQKSCNPVILLLFVAAEEAVVTAEKGDTMRTEKSLAAEAEGEYTQSYIRIGTLSAKRDALSSIIIAKCRDDG